MNWVLAGAGGLFVLVYSFLIVLALRRPLLARIALREVVRRPWQSALLIGGLLIAGASIITGLVLADSQEDSTVLNVFRQWGKVDLTVAAGGRFFSPDVAVALAGDPNLRPHITGVQAGVELVGSLADLDRRRARRAVRVIAFDPASQRRFGAYVLSDGTATYGQTLVPGEVFLSHNLAASLDARVGDRLQMSLGRLGATEAKDLTVAGITRPEGPGTSGLTPAVFATLETACQLAGTDRINVVRISARGEGEAELAAAHRAAPAVRAAVDRLAAGEGLEVREVKATDLATERTGAQNSRTFFLSISFLVVVAAGTLAVNLALALADERRPRLGVLRALGLTRRSLVAISVMEGALYSIAAALLASVPGILAGLVVARHFGALPSPLLPDAELAFRLSVRVATVVAAITSGALITLATLFAAAVRTSRMTIASAIRDLPEPPPQARRRWPRRLALAAFALPAVPAFALGNEDIRFLGGVALIVVAVTLARRLLPDRTRATLLGIALAGWSFALPAAYGARGSFPIFAVLASVFGLCVLVVANLQLLEATVTVLGRSSGRLRATLRLPLAYMARQPLRTGLTTGAFAVVLTIMVVLGVFLSAATRLLRDSLRYDVKVTSSSSQSMTLPPSVGGAVSRQTSIPTRTYVGPTGGPTLRSENGFVQLYEFSRDMLADPPVSLGTRDSRFGSEAAVWQALRDDPTWVVSGFGTVGQTYTLMGEHSPVQWRIAAQPVPGTLDGVIGSREALAAFESAPLGVTVLLKTSPGADPKAVAAEIQRSLFPQAVDATPTREVLDRRAGFLAFITALNVLMGMGLVTGVLTLGILALRAVVERRHAIGVLRAVGYHRRDVVTVLIVEAALTATIGVVIGIAAGAVFGFLFLPIFSPNARFGIDGVLVASALALIYGTLVLVTVGPALKASRLPPAQALRFAE